jgi:DNA-binding NarL/FixJ family response regulator
MSSAATVLLAEADAPTRTGLRLALARGGFEVTIEALDADAVTDAACRERPDLVLLATDFPGNTIRAVRTIAARVPTVRIVMLTPEEDGEELVASVLAGAVGYLGKDVSPARLPHVLIGVLAGEAALPRRHTVAVLHALRGRDARRSRVLGRARQVVTERQWELLQLLAEGRSTAEMARRLGISEVTARRHISAVLPKLGVRDRESAVELMRSAE